MTYQLQVVHGLGGRVDPPLRHLADRQRAAAQQRQQARLVQVRRTHGPGLIRRP
jgi:hypothetical protein